MSAGSFDRFSPLKGGGSGDGVGQRTQDRTPPSGASPQGLTSSPQPLKIVQDVHECIEKLKTTFEEDQTPIDDNNQTLHRFCARLEFLLQYDMKERKSITGRKKDYWDYFCNCIESVKGVNDGIKYVKTVGDCKTSIGKGRAFLRFCLMHHRLADSLQQCVTNGKVTSVWYGPNSIWLQHEKSSGIINALYDLNDVIFDLAPRGYDLDNSWPSFARKNMDGQHSWALSERSRASSISSLNSIGQEVFSPNKSNLTANIDSAELEHLAQELAISENVRSDLVDRMEALEQQKGIFQQSIAESRGELSMLETQHKQLQLEHKELQKSYRELEKKYDIQILETDLKEKNNISFTVATEEKLQRSEEQLESMRETVNQLQEEIKISKETLNTTVSERDSLKNELESIKDELKKGLNDIKTKEAEFEQKIDDFESEKEGLLHKVRKLEEEKVAEQGNTSDAQKLLHDKNLEIDSLGKTVKAMKHGFQWLKGLRDNQTYTEIEDLDSSTSNILKDISNFVVDIIKQKSTSEERFEALVEENKNITAEKVTIELKNNENQKILENLKMTVDDMNRKELDLQQIISSLEDQIKLEADRLSNVTDQLKEKEKILNEKEVSIAAMSAEKCHMVKELDTFEKDVSQLREHMERTQYELQKTNEFYNLATKGQSDLMEKLNSQEKQISEKDSRLFDLIEKEKVLSEANTSLKNDNEKLNVRNKEIEKESLNINERKDSVQRELENTKQELESSVKGRKESDKKLGQIQKRVSKIEKENINLKDVLTQLESDKQTLEKEMEEKIVGLRCEISKLENENETIAAEMNSSKAQVVHQEGEITLFKARISDFENQIASMTDSEKQCAEKVNCLEKEVSSKSFSVLSLEKDVETLSKENSQLKLDKENFQGEVKSHQNQLYEKQSEVLLLKEKLERAHNDLERTKEFYETAAKTESDLSERFKSLENNLNEKDNRISQMNEKEKGLTVEITKLDRDNVELEEKLETVKEKLNELSNTNSESLLQIDNLKSTLNDLQTEKEHLLQELDALRQNEISNQELIQNQRLDLEKSFLERGDLDQVIDSYKNKESKLIEHNKQLESKVFELEQKEIQVGKHLEQMKEDFDIVTQEKENLVEKVEDLDEKILSNEKDIEILNSECDKMNLLKNEMLEKFSESEKRNRQLFETVERLKQDYDIVSKDKYELEEKVETLEKELLLSKDNVISLKSDLSALEELKEEIQSRLENFEQKDVENISKIELLTNQVSALENKSEELMSSLNEINLSHFEKVTELEKLQNAFDKLCDEKHVKDVENAALIKTGDEKSNLIGNMQDEIAALNSEIASLNANNSRLQKEKGDLFDKLERTAADLKSVTTERNEMEQNLVKNIGNNEEMSESLKTTQSELSDLDNKFSSLQQDYEAEKVESEKLKNEISELLAKDEAFRQELMQVRMNLKEAEENGQSLLKDNRQLETEKASLNESLEQLDSKRNKIESEQSDAFTKLSSILYDSLGFNTVNELNEGGTTETLAELIKCLDSVCVSKITDMESLQVTLGEKDKELNTLHEHQKHLKLKEREYLKEIEEQSIALKEAEVNETKLQETLKEVDNMAEKINNLNVEKETLSNELECEIRKYQGLIDEAEREIEQMKLNIIAEKKETEKLRTKESEDNDVIVVLKNDIEKLNVEKSAIVKELADVRSDLQSECNKLIEEKSYLSQDLTTTKQYLNEAETTIKTNKSLIKEQKAHLQNLSESIRQLQENLSESQENYQNVSQSLVEVKNEKENQRQSFTRTICDLESKQSLLLNQITELESKLQETNKNLEVKSKELQITIQEKDLMSEKQVDMEGTMSDLRLEIENLKQTLLDSNAKAETFIQELELTRQNFSDSENELNKLSKEHKQLCDIYEKSTCEHDQYKLQVESQIAAALIESKAKLEDITTQKAELTETVDQLKSEKEKIEQKVAQLMDSIEEKDVCINENNAKLLELERSYEEMCDFNSELKKEINSKDKNISDLEKEIVILNEQCSAFELQIKTFEEETKMKDDKLKELEEIQSEKNELTAQVKVLEEKNNGFLLSLDEETLKFQSLKETSEETALKLTKLESEMETVFKTNDAAVESLKQEITSLENELEAVQTTKETELESLRQEVMAMEGTIETLNKTKNSEEEFLRQEISALKSDIETVYKDRDIEVESLKQNTAALENEIETVRQTKETEVESLKQEMKALENDLENVRQTKDEETESLKQEYSNLESESETVQKSKESEVESLRHEITALEFQLSAEQLQNEEKQKTAQFDETEFVEMKDKVMEQEAVIDDLQREMDGLRSISVQHKEQVQQIESLEEEVAEKNRENKILEDRLQQVESRLTSELESSQKVQHSLDDEKQKVEGIVAEKDRQIEELRGDIDQLKKKLVKLIKEKDTLWQKTDRLAHQHKLHVTEKWMDGSTVTNCLGCYAEFSFTLRKHHCRLCGRVFCYNCSSHWVMTTSSSKKMRACTACYVQYNAPTEEVKLEGDLEDQSVEIPKRHFIGKAGSLLDTSSMSIASSTTSFSDTEELNQEPVESLGTSDIKLGAGNQNTINQDPAKTSDIGFILGNETDEDKLRDTSEKGAEEEGDRFHVISDEEIQRSLTMSAEYEGAAEPEPNMSCSMYLNLEELESGDINSQNEVWIKAGRSYAVPVHISKANTVFGWEFTSYPKDVVFSATYRQNQSEPYKDAQVLVPPCKCDSHKEATRGELTAKQPGVYTLIFDNTYSKMTAKRVNYSLFSNKGLLES